MSFRFWMNGSHAVNKCFRSSSSLIPKDLYLHIPAPCCKLNSFPKRNIHSTRSRRQLLPIVSVLNGQPIKIATRHSLLVTNKIQVSGLHSTYQCAAALSSGSGAMSSDSPKSEFMNDLATNDVTMSPSTLNNVQDISANGSEMTVQMLSSPIDVAPNEAIMPLSFDTTSVQDILGNGSEIAEQTLSYGYTPVGLIQYTLDFAHVTLGLPWWGSIVCGTILLRVLLFPLMIKGQVNAAKLRLVQPELQNMQEKVRIAENRQNPVHKRRAEAEMQDYYKKFGINPIKGLIVPVTQGISMFSFFYALRQMSSLPVESMKMGGLFWFSDLTVADPYYILPVVSACTMLVMLEVGSAEFVNTPGLMKHFMRGMCVVMVPLTAWLPTAVFTYWVTSNFISLGQTILLKQPHVKKYYGLEHIIPPKQDSASPTKKEGFYEKAVRQARTKTLEKRKQQKYKEDLKNVYQKTFDYNPREGKKRAKNI